MADEKRSTQAAPWRWLSALAVLGLAGLHLLLVLHFVPRTGPGSGRPVVTSGYAIEIYRVARARLAEELFGASWAYDPLTLAGQRAGLVEPLGTRAFLVVARLGRALGGPVLAIHSFTLLLHAIFPLLGYAAARALRLPSRAAALTLIGYSSLWFFDSLVHGAWFSGRILWVAASATMVLSLSLLHRVLTGGGVAFAVLAALSGIAATVLHPVIGILCVGFGALLPFGISGVLAGRRLTAVLAAFAPVLLLVVAPVSVRGALSSEPELALYDTSMARILWDLLEVPAAGRHGPGATRTLVRSIALVSGMVGMVRWSRLGDTRRVALMPAVLACAAIGYAGASWKGWPVDPYLFLVPAVLATTLPAADVLSEVPWASLLVSGPPAARAVLAVGLALGIPRAARTVGTFVPELLPTPAVRAPGEASRSALIGLFEPMPDALRHEPLPSRASDLAGWLSAAAREGRVLVDDPALAGLLTVRTTLDVLGPIAERGASSRDADPGPLFAPGVAMRTAEDYLRRYAVSWVVLASPTNLLDGQSELLEPAIDVFGYRVRRVTHPTTLVMEGEGKVTELALGSIQVTQVRGARLTLRLHYDELLSCSPGCRVEPVIVPGDRTPFISVPEPPGELHLVVRR